jgi:hypothetical protein
VYLIVDIVRKRLGIKRDLYTLLQILSWITTFRIRLLTGQQCTCRGNWTDLALSIQEVLPSKLYPCACSYRGQYVY